MYALGRGEGRGGGTGHKPGLIALLCLGVPNTGQRSLNNLEFGFIFAQVKYEKTYFRKKYDYSTAFCSNFR